MKLLVLKDGVDITQVEETATALQSGKVILYPTETVYGLGAEINQIEAVNQIYRIKGREWTKPLSIAVSVERIEEYAYLTDPARVLVETFLPGPLTLVLKKKRTVNEVITGGSKLVGIRVPAHPFVQAVLEWVDTAIVSTSANISGHPATADFSKIDKRILEQVDLAIKSELAEDRNVEHRVASTVVDASTKEIKLLREGAIPFRKIQRVLKKGGWE